VGKRTVRRACEINQRALSRSAAIEIQLKPMNQRSSWRNENGIPTVCDKEQTMAARISVKRRRRVIALLKAISDLHQGDLLSVLKLDVLAPNYLWQTYTFQMADDGNAIFLIPGRPPASELAEHSVGTGEGLARGLEEYLVQILGFGEAVLPTYQKRKRAKQEIGGREFECQGFQFHLANR
jgi:hypothetical protein